MAGYDAISLRKLESNNDRLFPSFRKEAMKRFCFLFKAIKPLELKEIIDDNIQYLKEKGTSSQKRKEIAAAIGLNIINLLFPFLFYRKNETSDF